MLHCTSLMWFEHTLWDLKHRRWTCKKSWPKSLNIPYGIWNQKRATSQQTHQSFEHTLWDLKLVHVVWKLHHWQFEHTLWDLKLLLLWCERRTSPVWTYPMGFETQGSFRSAQAATFVWTYPMGFETQPLRDRCVFLERVWTYPMGFETHRATARESDLRVFEHTLWDLKPIFPPASKSKSKVWTYPMGFETLPHNQ